jgi:hypothetical protein
MKTVDVYKSLGEHLINDPRVGRYGMIAARHGFRGLAKLNPVAVWIDAGIAVCEACNSYLKYAAQKEINEQLAIENDLLRRELESQLKKIKLDYQVLLAGQNNYLHTLSQHLEHASYENKLILKEICEKKDRVFILHKLVCNLRLQGYSSQLEKLQTALDIQVNATLNCLIEAIV